MSSAVALVRSLKPFPGKSSSGLVQALIDIGFTIPAQGATSWNGEARQKVDFIDLATVPGPVQSATAATARNAAHLARQLEAAPYPLYE